MNGYDSVDQTIAKWLADAGAQDIPDRVFDAAFAEARHVRRARPLPGLITRFLPMSTTFPTAPPLALPRLISRSKGGLLLLLLALALLGAALLSVGTSPSPPVQIGNGLIALDSDGDIWVSMSDGSARTALTHDNDIELSPTWSPDGSRIAFWQWTNTLPTDDANYPNVVATIYGPGRPGSLMVMDANGSNIRPLVQNVYPGRMDPPVLAWSPNGQQIAYAELLDSKSQIDVVTVETGQVAVVASPIATDPAWSPDGNWLAYYVPQGAPLQSQIKVMRSDTGQTRDVTAFDSGGPNTFIDWSPDSARLVYTTGAFRSGDIWIVGANRDDPHALVATDGDDTLPDWSPTTNEIVYQQELVATGPYAFQLVDGDGNSLPPLNFSQGNPGGGTWSPDGTKLLGFGGQPGEIASSIVVLDVTTGTTVGLLSAMNNVGSISWQAVRD